MLVPIVSYLIPGSSTLRDLAAQALHNLTERDALYMREDSEHSLTCYSFSIYLFSNYCLPVLPSLLPLVTTPDPSLRHGALLATAELSHALYLQAKGASSALGEYLGQRTTEGLVGLVPRVRSEGGCLMGVSNGIFPLTAAASQGVQRRCGGGDEASW